MRIRETGALLKLLRHAVIQFLHDGKSLKKPSKCKELSSDRGTFRRIKVQSLNNKKYCGPHKKPCVIRRS